MTNITVRVRSFIISNERRMGRMFYIKTKQNGLYLCRTEIRDNEIIVSHGHINRHYYHKAYGEKLHIL
jgi:hypothetical protein